MEENPTEPQSKVLSKELGKRHWFWLLLWRGGALQSLVPWPAPGIWAEVRWRLKRPRNPDDKTRSPRDHGVWSAMAYAAVLTILYNFGLENLERASDFGRNLFTGAFLIGTLLSVSSGTVASAVIRSTAIAAPRSIRSLGAVFGWSLLFGLAGAGALVLYNQTPKCVRPISLLVGALGVVAEINAITFVFRVFLLGLVDGVRQDEKRRKAEADKLSKAETERTS